MDKLSIEHFRQLLEKEEMLRKSRKSFFHESQDEYIQLLLYRMMIQDQCAWQIRQEYLSILEDFIASTFEDVKEKRIARDTVTRKLYGLESHTLKRLKKLIYLCDENFKPLNPIKQQNDLEKLFQNSVNFESKGFSYLTDSILNSYYELRNKSDSEEEFRNFFAEVLLDIKKYFTK